MREILFRGKNQKGEWIEGKGVDVNCDIAYIITKEYDCDEGYDKKVILETIGQFTGLTDINGVKIFEGDICLCDCYINCHTDKTTFVIEFEPLRGWIGVSKNGWSEFEGSAFEFAEVIGNIHDDPDLLI